MDRTRLQRSDVSKLWLEVADELDVDRARALDLLETLDPATVDRLKRDRQRVRELLETLDATPAIAPGKLPRSEGQPPRPTGPGKQTRFEVEARIARAARRGGAQTQVTAGRPLPESLRVELEGALNMDLGDLELHTDPAAATAARAIGARAFATGGHIFFGAGRYDPGSAEGRRLIAHEVAHAVQPASASEPASSVSSPGDAHERAADRFAQTFSAGGPVRESPALAAAPATMLHREGEGEGDGGGEQSNADKLAEIQGLAMPGLLAALEGLDKEVREDFSSAHVGGPRLEAAMHAVKQGKGWKSYITAHNDVAGHLPVDQLDQLMSYLGGPEGEFRFYKDVGDNFDGSVEPGSTVTLYCRVRFYVDEGTNLSGLPPEGPAWVRATQQAVQNFGEKFVEVIKGSWGAAAQTITCAAPSVDPLTTAVEVSVVDVGEHIAIKLVPSTPMEGIHGSGEDQEGIFSIGANDERETRHGHTQTASIHEFGHIIGVDHPDPQGAELEKLKKEYQATRPGTPERAEAEKKLRAHNERFRRLQVLAEYGDRPEEQANIMGHGHELTTVGGEDSFDPFTAFHEIAKKWGEEFIVDPKLNEWSTG